MSCANCNNRISKIDLSSVNASDALADLPGVKTVTWHEQYGAWVIVHGDGTEITMPVRPRPAWATPQSFAKTD